MKNVGVGIAGRSPDGVGPWRSKRVIAVTATAILLAAGVGLAAGFRGERSPTASTASAVGTSAPGAPDPVRSPTAEVAAIQTMRYRFEFDRDEQVDAQGQYGSDRRIEDEAPHHLVVVGSVRAVRPGVGFWWEHRGEEEVTHTVSPDDARAVLVTAHVDVVVDQTAGRDPGGSARAAGDTVTLAITLNDGEVPSLHDYLEGGDVLALTYTGSELIDYQPGLHSVAGDGGYLATVDESGVLEFFAIKEARRAETGTADLDVRDVLEMATG